MVFEKKYDNGLRLVVKQMDGFLSVAMGVLVGTGACVEKDEEDGISHFIEHMQFKGTKKRNSFELSDAFDRIGAQVNAYTSRDVTCYYSKCIVEHTSTCFELLADLFLHSTFPEEEIEREKGVICEEISMTQDTPEDLCLDKLSQCYFGNQNYGRNILGTQERVRSFTVDDILRYKQARYCPENIVISFAGGIDPTTAQALVESYFNDLKKGNFEKRKIIVNTNSVSVVTKKPIEQMHIGIAYPTFDRNSIYKDTASAIDNVLGGSMSARLFQEVREKRGLAYSVYSYRSVYEETGMHTIYAGVNPKQAEQAYQAVLDVVNAIKKDGITKEEFFRSREQLKSSLLFGCENCNAQMLTYAKNMLFYNQLYDFEKRLEEINAMTYEQIFETLPYMFDFDKMAISLVGNTDKPFAL